MTTIDYRTLTLALFAALVITFLVLGFLTIAVADNRCIPPLQQMLTTTNA